MSDTSASSPLSKRGVDEFTKEAKIEIMNHGSFRLLGFVVY